MGHAKDPCPGRVLSRAIHGLVAGLIGGAAYVAVRDIMHKTSLGDASRNAARRAPSIAVATGLLMAIYSTFECTTEFARGTRDAANSFIAGGLTGSLIGSRGGPESMVINAVFFGLVFGIFDGLL